MDLSVVKAQAAVIELTLELDAPCAGVGPVGVGVTDPAGVAVNPNGVALTAMVGALVLVTLMMTQRRESSATFMINPCGFSITKLPRYVPVVLGATRSTEMSSVWPGKVRPKGTESGAPILSSE